MRNCRDAPWRLYQHQITGVEIGKAIMLNGAEFDGCRTKDGTMLEAKGPGFAGMMKDGEFEWWHKGKQDVIDQMMSQSAAAIGRIVEWHAAEKPMADFLHGLADKMGLKNIIVFHTPYFGEGASP